MSVTDMVKAVLNALRAAGVAGRRAVVASLIFAALSVAFAAAPARALEAIVIGPDQERIDITLLGELYEARGDRISVETAAAQDGVAGRMSVSAKTPGTNPNWIIFALNNPTDQTVSLWLTAQRYDMVGSQVIWPDLDVPRIENVTVSLGFKPETVESDHSDIYRLVLEPGSTITYIVELSGPGFPHLYLANPSVISKKYSDLTLFDGILLGITGVLALYLTAIFGANHNTIFPAASLIAWSVLGYLCVDFGFWHKLFQLSAADNAVYRAAMEAAIPASTVIFLYVFLQLRRWHASLTVVFGIWALAQLSLIGLAVIDAQLAAGLARLSYVAIAAIGSLLMTVLALRGQERALSLLPTWMLFLVWMFGGGVTVLGQLSGDIIVPALNAGLVLIVALLSFTVTQYAFHGGEHVYGEDAGELQMGAVALQASGASVWEWNVRRDEIFVGHEIDASLGHPPGTVRGNADDWLQHLHASDRERMRLMLATIREKQGGELSTDFRLRRADGSYLYYELRAQTVVSRQSKTLRCAGLLRDVTAQKRAQDRLMHNAIHDSLTGLPNRELYLDRIHCAIARAHQDGSKPTVIYVDIDVFQSLNRATDLTVSDSMLLTISRRLSRHLGPQDTLARIGGEQFAILLSAETEPRHIAMLAERVRRSLRAPMKIAGRDVVLTGSIGISVYDGQQATPNDLLREAETAMYRAKRSGADRIELYKPEMRGERSEREVIEGDLKQAVEKRQIRVFYQPIMRLGDEQLAGFAAQVRWQHPKLGALSAAEFLPIAEDTGRISEISGYVMERAVRQVARWHRAWPRHDDPLFVSINVSSRHLFKQDLVQDLRLIIGRESVPKGCLRLEVTESLIMENPEQAIEILDWLKGLGAGIALDEFGAGYSSLAYLHRLAVDTIKIDRSLISHGSDNKSGAIVLRSAMAMARELGKDVVAVGLEREEDVAYVRALGCDYAQGFYFGEPMTEREAMNLIGALAKTNKRDEKRLKKKKETEPEPLPLMGEDDAILEELPMRPVQPAAASGVQKSNLPIPLSHPVAKAAQAKSKGTGVIGRFRKQIGTVSAVGAGFGKKLSSLLKPVKKPKPQAKPKQAPQRPASQPAQAARDPQSLRNRLAQVDPADALPPRQPIPGVRSSGPGLPPKPPGQSPLPEMASDDFLNRRRRV
jgi:diguanylate cyclase (GGDEF)-like protein/PAS domain S-box-containing protein